MPAGVGALRIHQAAPLARDGKIFDQPPQTVERYLVEKKVSEYFNWRFNNKPRTMPCGKKLRMVLHDPALVHWSDDNWRSSRDTPTRDTGLDVHLADLPVENLRPGEKLDFTFYWQTSQKWEGADFSVAVEG